MIMELQIQRLCVVFMFVFSVLSSDHTCFVMVSYSIQLVLPFKYYSEYPMRENSKAPSGHSTKKKNKESYTAVYYLDLNYSYSNYI